MRANPLTIIAIIIGLILLAVGVEYVTHQANALPHFFPGYDATLAKVHTKHAIAAFILGIGAFVYAWFSSAPKKAIPGSGTTPTA